jgi:hypothetical protein
MPNDGAATGQFATRDDKIRFPLWVLPPEWAQSLPVCIERSLEAALSLES